ncbi:acetoacetyl-CoA synthetase [Trichonephila clavata]|uniref:Acetoacetyl-CoA synthetase n=1 Tax=Trichonephila clavata TaxID=2740835 RepID=A0A8X6HXS1_TRICU|nr:acetoacetyl-CoA synthetase [Trichonephila clavata]
MKLWWDGWQTLINIPDFEEMQSIFCITVLIHVSKPTEEHDLSALKRISAFGSIVKPESYEFMKKILKHVLFSSSYALTELNQVSLLTETSLPAYRGEINAACLGTSIEVIDPKGNYHALS